MGIDTREITARVLEFAKRMEIRDRDLAKEWAMTRQNISNMRSGVSAIPAKWILEFLARHREANMAWILFGEGEMFGDGSKNTMEIKDGTVIFSSSPNGKETESGLVQRLETEIREKDKQIGILEKSLENQHSYISKLLDR